MILKASDLPLNVQERMGIKPKPASKYNVSAKDTRTSDGIVFASKAEMHRYHELLNMQRNGLVEFFLRQVSFHLPGNVKYVVDFAVFYPDGRKEFEDVKGVRTAMYQLKRKQVEALYPVKIREIEVKRGLRKGRV